MKIFNTTKKTLVASHATIANTAFSRTIGLLNRKSLPAGEALIITQCRAIHMFFMRFAIDAIFLDKNKRVVGLVRSIKPFALSPYFWKASWVIEVPENTIRDSKTEVGDFIEWISNEKN